MPQQWTVWDPEREDFTLVYASSQKEAIVKAMERGYKPGYTNDCRPRTGDGDLMSIEEFKEFLGES